MRISDWSSDVCSSDLLVGGHARVAQAERHVLAHAHMRVERILLEDHRHAARARREVIDTTLADTDLATIDGLEPGYHPEQGGFAAAGRPEEHPELPRLYGQPQPIDHGHRPVPLAPPVPHHPPQPHPPPTIS